MIFNILIVWALLDFFQENRESFSGNEKTFRISFLRRSAEMFIFISILCGVNRLCREIPGAVSWLLPAQTALMYLATRMLKRSDSFLWMTVATAFYLAGQQQPFGWAGIFERSALIAAGVCGISTLLSGLQRRHILNSSSAPFAGLPQVFLTAALAAMVLSNIISAR